jgi:hypothetical protein
MIDILDMNEVERIIKDILNVKNIRRKRLEYINYEAGSGLLRKYVEASIKVMYPKTWANYTIAEYSLLKKVVDKKAKSYKEPPVRKLDTKEGTTVPDSETASYLDILKESRFNDAMKDIDRIFNQHKSAGLYFEPCDDCEVGEKEVNLYPLRPYEFDLVKDDDGEVICLILSYPGFQVTRGTQDLIISGDRADADLNEIEYVLWTKDNHIVIRCKCDHENEIKSLEHVELEGNPNNLNPYGVIPFAYLPFDFNEDYPSPSPLANQTIELNVLLSVYLTSANMQVGQLVLSFPSDQNIETVTQGMMTAIKMPQSKDPQDKPSTVQYVSPSPDLNGHKEAITTYLTMILDEQGINSAQVLSGGEKFSSGLDRLLSQSDVQSIIEDNQDSYVRFEQECYEVINAMFGNIFKSKYLQVIFKKPKMLTSDTDLLANLASMIDIGLLEDYEKFIVVDPNLSVEQAKEKLKRINESQSKAMDSMVSMSMGANGLPPKNTFPSKDKAPTNNLNGKV